MKERITKNRIDYVLQEIAGACIPFSKRNLDSHNKSCIMIVTEPTTPLIFHAQPGGTFSFMGCFMYQYPKQILTITQQVQSYIDAGMVITSRADVEKTLKSVGFYRLLCVLIIPEFTIAQYIRHRKFWMQIKLHHHRYITVCIKSYWQ